MNFVTLQLTNRQLEDLFHGIKRGKGAVGRRPRTLAVLEQTQDTLRTALRAAGVNPGR